MSSSTPARTPLPTRSDAPPRRTIATVCLSGTLDAKLSAAAHAGFDGIELFENDLITSPLSPADVLGRAHDLGLTIDLYQPFRDAAGLPEVAFAQGTRRLERKIDLMQRLGVDLLLVCSSVGPGVIRDDAVTADQLHRLAEIAHRHGCRIAYEALAWGTHVSTWTHAWDLVEHADHPALGLCLDSFHIGSLGTSTDDLPAVVPAEKLFFVQLADAPRLRMDVVQWSRHHRVFPGQGAFDLVTFTESVLAAGYTGPLSLEVFNDVFRQSDPFRTAVDGYRSLLVLEDAVARRAMHPGARLDRLPTAPALDGFGFAEVAIDARNGPVLTGALRSLGFTHTGQHRSKAVQLWEQGSARIVLNAGTEPPASDSTRVQAIAIQSADPPASIARATALRAQRVEHEHGDNEVELATVLAPDGVELIFSGSESVSGSRWSGDFLPTGLRPPADPPLLRLDHIALSQPFDHFEEAVLFYQSVLGLAEDTIGELAAPFGLVRTHAARSPSGDVRIALSVALLRRGDEWAPKVADPQHIAFVTDDLFATVRLLRERGAPLLCVPDNYYDDIDSRLDLAPELVEELRTTHVLYDQDAHGDFLHAYTEMLGGRMFFEILQRRGGYRGYGAANAPVRMAAQRAARLAREERCAQSASRT